MNVGLGDKARRKVIAVVVYVAGPFCTSTLASKRRAAESSPPG